MTKGAKLILAAPSAPRELSGAEPELRRFPPNMPESARSVRSLQTHWATLHLLHWSGGQWDTIPHSVPRPHEAALRAVRWGAARCGALARCSLSTLPPAGPLVALWSGFTPQLLLFQGSGSSNSLYKNNSEYFFFRKKKQNFKMCYKTIKITIITVRWFQSCLTKKDLLTSFALFLLHLQSQWHKKKKKNYQASARKITM